MFRRLHSASMPLAFVVCSAACGSSGEATPDAPGATVSCGGDPRLDSYSGELDKMGELGLLSFRFFDLDPATPAKGSNTFHVQVVDAAGDIMQGGLRVDLRMPDHGHGTSVEPVISFDPALGAYTITPVFLFMPGVWRLEFQAIDGATDTPTVGDAPMLDNAVLHFCVEG